MVQDRNSLYLFMSMFILCDQVISTHLKASLGQGGVLEYWDFQESFRSAEDEFLEQFQVVLCKSG